MKNQKNKKDLCQWISDYFKKNKFVTEQSFNVHVFTELEKSQALNRFKAELSNNNNSLIVRI